MNLPDFPSLVVYARLLRKLGVKNIQVYTMDIK